MEKNVDFVHLQHFSSILIIAWQIIHLTNFDMYTFRGGEGSEKVYVLYTRWNADN